MFSVFSKQKKALPGFLGLLILVLCLGIGMTEAGRAASDNICLESIGAQTSLLTPGKIEIRFTGNAAYSARQLRKEAAQDLTGLDKGEVRCPEIDDAAFQMEDFYRGKGFAMATVGYEVTTAAGTTLVLFQVNEGPQVRTEGIELHGVTFFPKEDLLALFTDQQPGLLSAAKPIFVEREMRATVGRIRDLYYAQGFLALALDGPLLEFSADRSLVTVRVKIIEGQRSIVGPIVFDGEIVEATAAPLADFASSLRGQPYTPWKKVELRSRIVEEYGRSGYSDPQVDVETLEEASGAIRLTAHIVSGPRVRISALDLTGNVKTTPSFIESRLALRPGDWYSVEKKRQSFENLYKTGLFSRLELNLAEAGSDEGRTLAVRVEELPSKEVSMEAGWGAYELLRGRLGVSENNLFGSGRQLKAEAGVSLKGEDITLQYSDPWFLGSDLRFSLPLSHQRREEPSFVKREDSIGVQFAKDIAKKFTTIASYDYRQTTLTAIEGMADAMVETEDTNYATASIGFQATRDSRNDLFFPSRGGRVFLAEELASQALGGEVDFFRSTAGIRWFIPLRPATVLALRYDTGFILPMGAQETIPLGERFFNGGENSVRSLLQDRLGPRNSIDDPLGGTAYNVISIELRHRLSKSFSSSLFVDLGNISPDAPLDGSGEQQYNSRSELVAATFNNYFNGFRTGVGVGLQYLLPVGPMRIDLAFNPDRRENRGEKDMVINFSVGMAF